MFSPTTVGGFSRGLVTLTFDDGWQSISTNAKPLLDARGLKTTQFIVSGFVNSGGYITTNQVQSWINGGHEIGAHTVSHPDLTTVSSNQLNTEVNQVKSYLSNTFGVNAVSFATPYGAYDQVVLPVIKAAYQQHRSVDVGVNAKDDFDKWNLKVCNVDNTTTQAQFNEWLTMATQSKLWVIFAYHGVDGSGETYNVTPAALTSHLDAVVNSGAGGAAAEGRDGGGAGTGGGDVSVNGARGARRPKQRSTERTAARNKSAGGFGECHPGHAVSQGREAIALIPEGEIATRILAHVKLPVDAQGFLPIRAPPWEL